MDNFAVDVVEAKDWKTQRNSFKQKHFISG